MTGLPKSNVIVTLRNTTQTNTIQYKIQPFDTELSHDWVEALRKILEGKYYLEKNFCFLGFPNSSRNLQYLCDELNKAIFTINMFNRSGRWKQEYYIEEYFCPETVRYSSAYPIATKQDTSPIGLTLKHDVMNRLHNHFEVLQGTVDKLSDYYKLADYDTKYAIRQLNILCHEIETLVISQHKAVNAPEWVRPSQITTFLDAPRYLLTKQHKDLMPLNGYDRRFGYVYLHWSQIGKTLFEVFRDEHAPDLDATTCEAITSLKYFSGEFDIEWGNDVTYSEDCLWHVEEQDAFKCWLRNNNLDPEDKELCLGYFPVGFVKLQDSFQTNDPVEIRNLLSNYQDIYSIEIDDVKSIYDYAWTDSNYRDNQLELLKQGYDHTSK